MIPVNRPLVLWDYCIERHVLIENSIAKENFLLKGSSLNLSLTGEITDISNLCNFSRYEWIKFRKLGEKYPFPTEWLGRCLGPAINKGNAMSQHVMTESGEVIPVQTLRKLTPAELTNPVEINHQRLGLLGQLERQHAIMGRVNPIEVAEFAAAKEISNEPAFVCWVKYTLKKRNKIVAALNARMKKKTHKFGLKYPNLLVTPSGWME